MAIIEYPAGEAFPGVIGRTTDESSPAWPAQVRATAGAPNVVAIVLDALAYRRRGALYQAAGEAEKASADLNEAGRLRLTGQIPAVLSLAKV